ncbi:MAG TPA: hypothetical protein VHC72_18125, partial [Bryobacteraceae bacterium]|nr:hypothetical protein [Bryobacteraceae bacterium]
NVRYVGNVRDINLTNIRYSNRQNATFIPQSDFASARPVRGSVLRYSPGQVRDAPVLSAPHVVPLRASVALGTPRSAPFVRSRQVVARTAPPPAPVSFQARQQMLTQNNGEPLRRTQVEQLRRQQPAAVINRQEVRAIGGGGRGGSRPGPQQQPQPEQPRQAPVFRQPPQQRQDQPAPAIRQRPQPQQQPQPQQTSPPPASQGRPAPPVIRQRPAQQPQAQPQPSQPQRQPQAAPPSPRSAGERPQGERQQPQQRQAPPQRRMTQQDDRR